MAACLQLGNNLFNSFLKNSFKVRRVPLFCSTKSILNQSFKKCKSFLKNRGILRGSALKSVILSVFGLIKIIFFSINICDISGVEQTLIKGPTVEMILSKYAARINLGQSN